MKPKIGPAAGRWLRKWLLPTVYVWFRVFWGKVSYSGLGLITPKPHTLKPKLGLGFAPWFHDIASALGGFSRAGVGAQFLVPMH